MPEKAQRFNQDKCKVLDLTEKINCPKIVKKKKRPTITLAHVKKY